MTSFCDQGLPQYIQIGFQDRRVVPRRLCLTFQGGFVGTTCTVQAQTAALGDWKLLTEIYPEDVNRQQVFGLSVKKEPEWAEGITALKIVFQQSSDFFGRITVYDLQLDGTVLQ